MTIPPTTVVRPDTINQLVNEAMLARQRTRPSRDYLGASRWGEECGRKLAYEFHDTPTDEEDQFPGEILRIFDMGHDSEERMAEYLRLAGFDLQTEHPAGGQFGFTAADGKLAGHCDGIIHSGPLDLPYPLVWESKALNDKSSKDTEKKGVQESKPIYYGQLQTYMAYFDIHGGGLFTSINRNTGKIYSEFVPFVPAEAQWLSDKALRIIRTEAPEEEQRMSEDPSHWKCRFCDFHKRCHGIKEMRLPSPKRKSGRAPWLKPSRKAS